MNMEAVSTHLLLCNGKSCMRNGAEEVANVIRQTIVEEHLNRTVHTTKTFCNGQCRYGPIAYPGGDWYQALTTHAARELVLAEARKQVFQQNLLYRKTHEGFASVQD
ncbi:ferredoxin [Halobacillus sp. A5]|uniref:(2Fe-2S) ferredoxin domain-containing protein n=1 Tax=Halobacillus sp. A5 TaxID=2880263 RepID=UPI0020A6D75B|nr:(2Fe-2S) ferredoxin domain-containing protein [Halobacillus sp. A5]MCP3027774.1 (2Fe-2S) ferredoxin domain-containing protein [Halobacillus sp. A5]